MKRNLFYAAFVALLILNIGNASATPAGWANSSFNYRNCYNVNGSTITDYQLLTNISYSANMNSDFSDLRPYHQNGTASVALPYWIESKIDSNWASVWTKADYIDNGGDEWLCWYYGNTTATNQSNISATFILGDDFNGASLNPQWTTGFLGSGATVTQNGSGYVDLSAPSGVSAAAGINSTRTLTCNVSVVWNRMKVSSATNSYANTHIGNGVITCDGGTSCAGSDYWDTQLNTGYTFTGETINNYQAILKHTPATSYLSPYSNINTADFITYRTYQADYWCNGTINYWIYNMSKSNISTAIDTQYAAAAKTLAFTQGGDTSANVKTSYINWTYVRAITATEPTQGAFAGEENPYSFSFSVASPSTATYYVSNVTLNFTVSGANASFPCWSRIDSVVSSLGSIANNTPSVSTLTLTNGAHSVNVTCYGGSPAGNTTSQRSVRQ